MNFDLTNLQVIKSLMTHYNLSAQKSLGQHFLVDKDILNNILSAANLGRDDFVVEVGPGFGVLTLPLAEQAGRVLGIETDQKMLNILRALSGGYPNIDLLPANILKLDSQQIHQRYLAWSKTKSRKTTYKLVSNLPYYITSAILKQFLETKYRPELIVVMVQREVAERITAAPGEMSILSVSIQLFGQPEIVQIVPKNSFWPKPEVDSAILKITPYKKIGHGIDDIKLFFRIVKAGFGERRKQLHNALSGGLVLDDQLVRNTLAGAGIDPTTRAQDLSLSEWGKIYHKFRSKLT